MKEHLRLSTMTLLNRQIELFTLLIENLELDKSVNDAIESMIKITETQLELLILNEILEDDRKGIEQTT